MYKQMPMQQRRPNHVPLTHTLFHQTLQLTVLHLPLSEACCKKKFLLAYLISYSLAYLQLPRDNLSKTLLTDGATYTKSKGNRVKTALVRLHLLSRNEGLHHSLLHNRL